MEKAILKSLLLGLYRGPTIRDVKDVGIGSMMIDKSTMSCKEAHAVLSTILGKSDEQMSKDAWMELGKLYGFQVVSSASEFARQCTNRDLILCIGDIVNRVLNDIKIWIVKGYIEEHRIFETLLQVFDQNYPASSFASARRFLVQYGDLYDQIIDSAVLDLSSSKSRWEVDDYNSVRFFLDVLRGEFNENYESLPSTGTNYKRRLEYLKGWDETFAIRSEELLNKPNKSIYASYLILLDQWHGGTLKITLVCSANLDNRCILQLHTSRDEHRESDEQEDGKMASCIGTILLQDSMAQLFHQFPDTQHTFDHFAYAQSSNAKHTLMAHILDKSLTFSHLIRIEILRDDFERILSVDDKSSSSPGIRRIINDDVSDESDESDNENDHNNGHVIFSYDVSVRQFLEWAEEHIPELDMSKLSTP